VDNDGNASMLAEARHGAAAGARHAVMVSLGTGIGGGLWLNGEVYRGASGMGGELGHVVLELHGPECPGDCPGIGCFEALVSGIAIGREGVRVAEREPESALGRRLAADKAIDGGIVTEMAHDGDQLACDVLASIGERLGFGLVGLVNTFNPEVIVIGGGAARGGDLLLEPARAVIAAHALPPAREGVRLVPAHYGDEAGMVGAALMALEALP
jgi:glucokinase